MVTWRLGFFLLCLLGLGGNAGGVALTAMAAAAGGAAGAAELGGRDARAGAGGAAGVEHDGAAGAGEEDCWRSGAAVLTLALEAGGPEDLEPDSTIHISDSWR